LGATPDQASGGEISCPSQVYLAAISPPWGKAVEVSLKVTTDASCCWANICGVLHASNIIAAMNPVLILGLKVRRHRWMVEDRRVHTGPSILEAPLRK